VLRIVSFFMRLRRGDEPALIYTRMGVVFKATTWDPSRRGVRASGAWSTGPEHLDVFLPWTSVDSIRFQ
jgi:hypothetical protein